MTQATLLIELLTEELPPKALPNLAQSFAQGIAGELQALGFAPADAVVTEYATPRRLAVTISAVSAVQPEQKIERKGPAVSAGFAADGQPTPALAGFARSCGVAVEALERMHDGKQDVFVFRSSKPGQALAAVLAGIVAGSVKKLPAPKLMRWGDKDGQFIRPVHGLVMLHGAQVVPGEVLGLTSRATTRGHRFLSQGEVAVAHADRYAAVLAEQGKVVVSFAERRDAIARALNEAAGTARIAADPALLDEVTALVEWPVVLSGQFSEDFLRVPQECLILSMKQHQKYFPLLNEQGRLLPRFLVVSNLQASDSSHIVHGNERVLRARLSDAKFFFEQDQKTRLEDRLPKLANVVYHNKLGSQLARVERLVRLAGDIAGLLGADVAVAERAARLAKIDLLTDMVGEFPELQGSMGKYYALHDGESAVVADAIEQHYWPAGAGRDLPRGPVACAVALADKLDTLIGIWGIGLIPTGDKDPFGLRRAALGVLRILMETPLPLDLAELLQRGKAAYGEQLASDTVDGLLGFMQDRLRHLLRDRHPVAVVEAVVSQGARRIDQVPARVEAVLAFQALPEAEALAAANKRIGNILKKTTVASSEIDPGRLLEPAEQALYALMQRVVPTAEALAGRGEYTASLKNLAELRPEVDAFFDKVMVMAEDEGLRANRLALLSRLATALNQVADISRLAA